MNSDGSKDASSRTKTQELRIPRELVAPPQTSQSASSHRNTLPDPSDTYMAPQFQESFNQLARATMNQINRTSGRTLGKDVPSQRTDCSLSNSERTSRAIVPASPTRGKTALRSHVVDIRKNLAFRNFFVQVAAEHPRACLNGISRNPAVSDQAIPSGNRHLIVGDSLVRDCRVFRRSLCGPGHQDDGVSEWGPGGYFDSDVGHQRYLEGSCYPREQVGTSGGLLFE